jgi:hypothetical protein
MALASLVPFKGPGVSRAPSPPLTLVIQCLYRQWVITTAILDETWVSPGALQATQGNPKLLSPNPTHGVHQICLAPAYSPDLP